MKQVGGDDVPIAKPCQELEEAWSIFFDETNDNMTNNFFSDRTVLEKLQSHFPALEDHCLSIAWECCRLEIEEYELPCGIEKYESRMYDDYGFSWLFAAAAKKEHWEVGTESRIYNDVTSSIAFRCKERRGHAPRQATKLTTTAQRAVTLVKGLDAFCMYDVQGVYPKGSRPFYIERNKGSIATTATAHVVSQCIEKEHYRDVSLPFCFVRGHICSLYVTTLDDDGVPCVKVVGYPDGDDGRGKDLRVSPTITRKKFFVASAVLLSKFKALFETHGRQQYKELLSKQRQPTDPLPSMNLRGQSTRNRYEGNYNNNDDVDQTGRRVRPGWLLEEAAHQAATCGGMFSNVEYPMERFLRVKEEGLEWGDQTTSPYYFRGCATSDMILGMTTKDVFIKVFNSKDRSFAAVESERLHHKLAFDAGIPVAFPVLDEILRSNNTNGTEYFVLVTEYLDEDPIVTVEELLHFSIALMETVLKLHNQAGMLHCGLKPANVRWNNGVVKLIDFEWAQKIDGAKWHPGPHGFMSPEVKSQTPCSIKSDAYAVGRTIEVLLHKLEDEYKVWVKKDEIGQLLNETARQLLMENPESRWSLQAALDEIQAKTDNGIESQDTVLQDNLGSEVNERDEVLDANH